MVRSKRSQSAIVGAVIIALVMFASLLTAIYVMNEYGSYAKLSYQKSTVLTEASELQRSTYAWFSYSYSPNGTLNGIVIAVSSGFPYSYEISAVVVVLTNGQALLLGPGPHPGIMEAFTEYGSQDWLPAAAPAGGSVSIVVYVKQYVQAVSLVVQSGYAMTSIPAVYSLVAESYYSPPTSNSSATTQSAYVPPSNFVGTTLLGRKIVCQANITLYNPGPLPLTDLTLNLTVNMTNKLISTCGETSYISYTGKYVPLSNMIFAYRRPKGLMPMYTWIESYNSSLADVWVRIPSSLVILSGSYQTIYLLFLNASLLGTGYLGINSYYTGFPFFDNIGNVMERGLLVQVYRDYSNPPSLFVNSQALQGLLASLYSGGNGKGGSSSGCSYIYPKGLYGWIYSLPMSGVTETFSTNYLGCSGTSTVGLPSGISVSGYFSSQLQSPINSGFLNGGLVLWGSGWAYGANILFNWSSVPTGQTSWPGNVSAVYGDFAMKAIGWFAVERSPTSSANYLMISADDYAAILMSPSSVPWITTTYTSWIPSYPPSALQVTYSNLSAWGSKIYKGSSRGGSSTGYSIVDLTGYPDSYGLLPYTIGISLTSLNLAGPGGLGDYRTVVVYAQANPTGGSGFSPHDDDTYLAVFLYHGSGSGSPQPSTMAFPSPEMYWYSPIYPQDGIMPLLYCSVPDLLVLQGQPLVSSPPAPTPSVPGYGWIVA